MASVWLGCLCSEKGFWKQSRFLVIQVSESFTLGYKSALIRVPGVRGVPGGSWGVPGARRGPRGVPGGVPGRVRGGSGVPFLLSPLFCFFSLPLLFWCLSVVQGVLRCPAVSCGVRGVQSVQSVPGVRGVRDVRFAPLDLVAVFLRLTVSHSSTRDLWALEDGRGTGWRLKAGGFMERWVLRDSARLRNLFFFLRERGREFVSDSLLRF